MTSKHFRVLVILSLALGPCFPVLARASADGPVSKELKRTAHRMRIPAERLRNARSALGEATDVARRLEATQVGMLANLWLQIDRKRAPAMLEQMFGDLRAAAFNAKEERDYAAATGAAQGVLHPLSEIDYERADQLARSWPEPPSAFGETVRAMRGKLESGFRAQSLNRLAYQDPERAAALLESADSTTGFGLRAPIVRQLMTTGKKDEAARLIERAKNDFAERQPTANNLHDYAGFVGQLAQCDPDRALEAFNDLARAAARAQLPPSGSGMLRIGERNVALSSGESVVLNAIRSFQSRPELTRRALEAVPDLKAKIDGAGGIDNLLQPSLASGGAVSFRNPTGGWSTTSGGSPLARELAGKASKDPEAVRGKLRETAADAEGVRKLLHLAQQMSYPDPDLASLALEAAAVLLPRIESKQQKSDLLLQLIQSSRQVDGDVDPNLIREGFILTDDLRQEAKVREATNSDGSRRGITPADHLESALVAELARDDFDSAMRYVRSMPDGSLKLQALVGICEALRQNY